MPDILPGALILGVGGQDGAYLARLLVARGVAVSGTTRGDGELARLGDLQIASEVRVLRARYVPRTRRWVVVPTA